MPFNFYAEVGALWNVKVFRTSAISENNGLVILEKKQGPQGQQKLRVSYR